MKQSFFQDPAHSGVFHLPADCRDTTRTAASTAGVSIIQVSLGAFGEKEDVLCALGRALRFPDWYGANLDALYDCLTDPDWQPSAGVALCLSGLDRLRGNAPEDFSILIDVFRAAIETRREMGTPLWVFLDTPAPGLPRLPMP